MEQHTRFFVIGIGSIGQRHIRNLRGLGIHNIAAFDPIAERLAQVVREHNIAGYASLEVGLESKPHIVLVCTPPHLHVPTAIRAIESGAHVFMEKPISNSLDGLAELLNEAEKRQRLLYVGYNLRFHAGLIKLKELLDNNAIGRLLAIRAEVGQYLPDWRPTQDYRAGYNVSAAMGGGIILDASHELDYVRWLGGEVESVYCASGHLSRLEMDTEDTAAITLRMSNNILAEVHLDCVQRGYARSCKLVGDEGTLIWDFQTGVRLLTANKTWQDFPISPDLNETYVAEMRHFLACIRGDEKPLVDGATGKRVLEIALAAKQSTITKAEVKI